MNLVLIETSGNQSYIFGTNKLRENVGASELVYRAGTQMVLDAVGEKTIGGPKNLWSDDPMELRQNLCNPSINRPITDPEVNVEVIVATSGKALLLAKNRDIGRRIVRQVTMKLLESAPGVDVCGVLSDDFDWETDTLNAVNKQVHDRLEEVRSARPGPALRFLRLPVVEDCRTSGLPAARVHDEDEKDKMPRSAVSISKWENRRAYRIRMQKLPGISELRLDFAEKLDDLEKDAEWLAVVHADGNGLGEIFLNFGEHTGCERADQNPDYVAKFRRFSLALDVCTEKAFLHALQRMNARDDKVWFERLILPLVLGGDDMTIVCDGKCALQFTRDFLDSFENQTGQPQRIFQDGSQLARHDLHDIVPELAKEALSRPRLSACAGVAIIKPHYPFSAAYDLAEELIRSAKRVKSIVMNPSKENGERSAPWPCSALDFHVLYDSAASELDEIRGREVNGQVRGKLIKDDGRTRLYARPYVISTDLAGALGQDWARNHSWENLTARVEAILQPDKNDKQRRALPNSQLHDLRAGLFLGREVANERYRLISHRYEDASIGVFEEDGDGVLFFEDRDNKGDGFYATRLLDAMDASNFWVRGESEHREARK
jgi:hypothetical protein